MFAQFWKFDNASTEISRQRSVQYAPLREVPACTVFPILSNYSMQMPSLDEAEKATSPQPDTLVLE